MSGRCVKQENEKDCDSLKYKDKQRCTYEKKWLSYIRGGNCFISEDLIKYIISNLSPFIDIDWNTFKLSTSPIQDNLLPNPDKLSKTDITDILHDLTYHIRSVFKESDIITVLEEKHGEKLINLSEQELLYYMYLFSFVVYVSQFLSFVDFQSLLRDDNSRDLQNIINSSPSKKNLLNFIQLFFSLTSTGKHKPKGWMNSLYSGILLSLILIGFIPAGFVLSGVLSAAGLGKTRPSKKSYENELRNYIPYLTPNAINEIRQFQTVTQTPRNILEDMVKNNDDYGIQEYLKNITDKEYIFPYIEQAIRSRRTKSTLALILSSQYKNLSNYELAQLVELQLLLKKNIYSKKGLLDNYIIYKMWNDGAKEFSKENNINIDKVFPGLSYIIEDVAKEYNFDTMEIEVVKEDISEEEIERLKEKGVGSIFIK